MKDGTLKRGCLTWPAPSTKKRRPSTRVYDSLGLTPEEMKARNRENQKAWRERNMAAGLTSGGRPRVRATRNFSATGAQQN
jgi:hypothetical protein